MNIETKIKLTIVVAIFMAVGFGLFNQNTQATASEKPRIEKVKWFHPPNKLKKVIRFKPWAKPSVRQVFRIMAWERKKWGGPSLKNRIRCESNFRWHETYGIYKGLLQYGPPAWAAAWPSTPKRVRVVTKRVVKRPIIKLTKWSDRGWVKQKVGKKRQRVWIVRRGRLPRKASPYHGWASVRAGQRAVAGYGPTTTWACGL